MNWMAWYTDGRTYRSDATAWPALPATGLLHVTEYERPIRNGGAWYRRLHNGADWLWLHNGEFGWLLSTGAISSGVWLPPPANVPPELVKRGDPVPDEEWERTYREASAVDAWPM